jgi:membrane-bound serine protease (ClpP class)
MTAPADPNAVYLFVSLGLIGLAVVLLVLELLIPSGGALAVATGVSAIASVVAMFAYDLTWGAVYLALLCIASPVVGIGIMKLWVNTPVGRRMVLSDETRDGGTQGISVGDEGTTLTVLRPVGTVRIGQVRVDGLAESGFIDVGRRVVVTELIDGNAKVREVDSATG